MASRIHIKVDLNYKLSSPGPAILVLEAAGTDGQELTRTELNVGAVEHFARVPAEEGIGEKIIIRATGQIECAYEATVLITRKSADISALSAMEMDEMPGDALRYLLPSRYCQAERFYPFVLQRFGDLTGGAKVAAIRDWVEQRLDYVSGVSNDQTTAVDTYIERRGVCRDYAHLFIALCRAAQIPARIASVYAPTVQPPDFHAVAEVFLEGSWHLIDATGMASADNMAVIAVGRDAVDIAFLTTLSAATLVNQEVIVEQGT